MKKKFIQKMLAALCATTAIVSIAPSFASANPNYENIIDKNSQNPEDQKRNEIRRIVNDEIEYDMLTFLSAWRPLCWREEKKDTALEFSISTKLENEFDRFIYQNIANEYADERYIKILENFTAPNIKTKFNFLDTRIAICNGLVESENDLIKQLLTKFACQDILDIYYNDTTWDRSEYTSEYYASESNIYSNPYYLKEMAEKVYIDYMHRYYNIYIDNDKNNNTNQIDLQTNKAKYQASIEEAKNNLIQWQTKQKAFKAAICDADNQTQRDIHTEDEIFKTTYYETYALANAEMHVKSGKNRMYMKIFDKNMQAIYDNKYDQQYNSMATQMGIRDGLEANEDQQSSYDLDESTKKSYHEGYLIGARKRAEKNIDDVCANQYKTLEYKEIYADEEAQKTYLESFLNHVYNEAFLAYSIPRNSGLDGWYVNKAWNDFLQIKNNDSPEMIDFKKSAENKHREGRLKGCEELGYKYGRFEGKFDYAMRKEYRNLDFKRCMRLHSNKSEEFKNECKKAYENGLKRGLAEIGKKMEIEEGI